jgi:hypothetical protein
MIERDEIYQANFDFIGNSKNNIKVFHNFLSNDQCNEIINNLDESTSLNIEGVWQDRIFAEFSFPIKTKKILKMFRLKLKPFLEKEYLVKLLPNSLNQHIVKWSPGEEMEPHIDDIGTVYNHISSILYLNDNYDGGEIFFPQHEITIKPIQGDLLCFPGNLNYKHGVKKVNNGTRYTMTSWFRFSE